MAGWTIDQFYVKYSAEIDAELKLVDDGIKEMRLKNKMKNRIVDLKN